MERKKEKETKESNTRESGDLRADHVFMHRVSGIVIPPVMREHARANEFAALSSSVSHLFLSHLSRTLGLIFLSQSSHTRALSF